MADEEKPVQPIVRKKSDEDEGSEETATPAPAEGAPKKRAAAPTEATGDPPGNPPVDPVEQPVEQPAETPAETPEQRPEEVEEAIANPELSEKFAHAKPVPGLRRRVVDMKNYEPRKKKKTEPDPMLVEKPEEPVESEEETAPPERERAQVRVQAGSLSDFEAMLAESEEAAPPRQRLEVGEKYEGIVTSIGQKWIYVDLGGGREGVARVSDYVDKAGELTIAEDEEREFYVLGSSEGTALLGSQLSTREAAMDAIETAFQTGAPLTGRVADKNKGGFEVDLGNVRAFCPISQIELGYTEDADEFVGRSFQFRVTEIREESGDVVVSRAALLEEEQAKAAAETLEQVEAGMTVAGTITRLTDFGAFVDIGGVEGLIHVSELGFSRVDHPSDVVSEGQEVRVKILNIDRDERGMRIGLSMKETMEDPWEAAMKDVHVGATVTGTITRLEPYGAFVEVAPNVEGLVHVSEMSWEKHVKRPSDIVTVGQQVSVEVQDVDLARRRISLSMKGAAGDPWNEVTERYKPGQEVTGTVENIEDFGAFVALGSGITALIPRSEMGLSSGGTPHSRFSRDDTVTARVLNIEPERRRISLSLKSAEEVAAEAGTGPKSYTETPSSGLGTFGDLLKDKLKDD